MSSIFSIPEALIVAAVLLLLLLMLLYFQRLKRKDQKAAEMRLSHLNENVQRNRDQLIKRKQYLNTYNLLAYNLNEALIIQPEIIVR
ncbi:hypothetical protein [Leeuwenhoekiella nanhaiensis]|uniref:Uncharacterized protein n=1 Tax=Leeuwenhoekiella nanhaiensis TaxID=1655491 RepID=A0A2G1VNJ0_9FLAO|nr:hypothetical protein [Leeuwenhoekiella nanhaiensis]PHQ28323.1 hypothetical protein CJ305_15360 [Leeuwenhoekiella nanhaiensis]